MQFPESWLREFCNPPLSSEQLADTLTMAGLEVEERRPAAPPFSGVVVARIEHLEPHPQAERLRVCQVDVGGGERLQIVCGAPNARAGMVVPCARVGAVLPPGPSGEALHIGLGQLRGVASHGMLCSAQELGIADDASGLLELPADAPLGQDVRTCLQLDDQIFTLKLTPNLAHCLSVYGVARELAALTGAPLHTPALAARGPHANRGAAGASACPRSVWALQRPHRARHQRRRRHPGLDGAAAGALRPAQRFGAGGHLQLRDVRVRPPLTFLTWRTSRAACRCAGAAPARRCSCSTAKR